MQVWLVAVVEGVAASSRSLTPAKFGRVAGEGWGGGWGGGGSKRRGKGNARCAADKEEEIHGGVAMYRGGGRNMQERDLDWYSG